jgi:uncharacterized membrane protein YsdA (DUF1294 family)
MPVFRSPNRRPAGRRSPRQTFVLAAAGLVVALGVFLLLATGWHPYGIWLASLSGITLALYAYDKAQARLGGLRVPEVVLHGVTLLGGFPGAWAGRFLFRHKLRKGSFLVVLAFSTLMANSV